MSSDRYELRKVIREVLDKGYFEIISEHFNSSGTNEILDWMRFEEFGTRILEEIGYPGNYKEILTKIKTEAETQDGWHFDS